MFLEHTVVLTCLYRLHHYSRTYKMLPCISQV